MTNPNIGFSGPIPAHAGEPCQHLFLLRLGWAYPRSRGGTPLSMPYVCTLRGLSPLTRGNLPCPAFFNHLKGPIPAHAGEPDILMWMRLRIGAYPRSRGGTRHGDVLKAIREGLSPLTRGNLDHVIPMQGEMGPIPAHAGEPGGMIDFPALIRAYPRSRGGTLTDTGEAIHGLGLSPLTRGNLYRANYD